MIRLIKESGYVQLCQLKQKYSEKYGRELCKRPLKKWLDKIPAVYIDHHPVKDSIHVHCKEVLKRLTKAKKGMHEAQAQEGIDEQNPKKQKNNDNKKKGQKKKKNKTTDAGARSRQENTQTRISPLLQPSCSPRRQKITLTSLGATSGASIAASAATTTTEQEKEQEGLESNEPAATLHLSRAREVNERGKNAPKKKKAKKPKKEKKPKNLAIIMAEQNQKRERATKKKNELLEAYNNELTAIPQAKDNLPSRYDCYYGMANHKIDPRERGRGCIMHFGSTSSGKTFWPKKKTFKTKGQGLNKSKTPFSRAIVSGYMANKIKNSGIQKAARKVRNLARLRKKYNPRPAAPTAHALQRYKERGKYSSPIYKPASNNENEVVVVTYVPIQRKIYADARSSTLTIRREVKRMSGLSKQTDLPKSKLSSRDAYLFKLSSQALKKKECRRRKEQRQRAYAKRSPIFTSEEIDELFHKKKWKKKKKKKKKI